MILMLVRVRMHVLVEGKFTQQNMDMYVSHIPH